MPPSGPRTAPVFRRANNDRAAQDSFQNVGQDVISDSQPKGSTWSISEGSTAATETFQVSAAGACSTRTGRPLRKVSVSDVDNHTPHDTRDIRKDVMKDSSAKDRTGCISGDPTIAIEACQAAKPYLDGHAILGIVLNAPGRTRCLSTGRIFTSWVGSPASCLRTIKATMSRAMTSATTDAAAAQMPSPPAAVEAPPSDGNPAHPMKLPIVADPPVFDENAFVLHRRRFGHRGRTPLSVVMLAGWDQQVKRAVRQEVAAMEWYTPEDLPEDVRKNVSAMEYRRAKDLLQETCVFDDP